MKNVAGKRVLITGAASGIGYCLAENFAKAGAYLILTDINGEALTEAVRKLQPLAEGIDSYTVDVSKREQVEEMAAAVIDNGGLDILVNNAGIGHSGEIAETSLEKWRLLVDVNFFGPLYHVYAFLPYFMRKRGGQIANVSSGQAFFRLPTWGPYAVIKLALGAASEIMHYELKKFDIDVTTVYPFMVNTPFYNEIEGDTFGAKLSMKLLPFYSMSPEKVGRIIFKAIKKRKAVEMVSVFNDVGYYMRLMPPVAGAVSAVTTWFLGKDSKDLMNDLA